MFAVVGLMLGLYMALQVLAHSEFLHQCVHEDSSAPNHECVVKLVAEGQLLIGLLSQFEIQSPGHDAAISLPPSTVVLDAARLLPPGRAPPFSPA